MPVDRERAERAIAELLRALGRDPEADDELRATPQRVALAWATELVDGYDVDVTRLLTEESSSHAAAGAEIVQLGNLAVSTICPHHLMPARGTAAVLYRPGARITGLGTLARLVDAFAHRLTLQEAIGRNVADALLRDLGAQGAACRLRMTHSCLASRGERQAGAFVETLALAGSFAGADRDAALFALARLP